MDYIDFALKIEPKEDGVFEVTAEQRLPTGKIHQLPGSELFRPENLLRTRSKIVEAIGLIMRRQSRDDDSIMQFGRELFQEAFVGVIGDHFCRLRDTVKATQRGLRIRLELPPALQSLPWELMVQHDEGHEHFLCRSVMFSVVRSRPRNDQMSMRPISLPLMVLVVVANPMEFTPLDARKEIRQLLESLSGLVRDGKVQIDFIHGADTLEQMSAKMSRQEYHIVHFIGHGQKTSEGTFLVFEDQNNRVRELDPENIFFAIQTVNLPRLVFLNICQGASTSLQLPITSIAEGFLRARVPAVIAHQFEISDLAASLLSKHLYDSLLSQDQVDEALAKARHQVSNSPQCQLESLTPVLFLHNVTGHLFTVTIADRPHQPKRGLFVEHARQALAARHWSEAADFAQAALLLSCDSGTEDIDRCNDLEVHKLLDQALANERLDVYLHEAAFAENLGSTDDSDNSFTYFEEAINWYEKFLNDPMSRSRALSEREFVKSNQAAARARIAGFHRLKQLKRYADLVSVGVRDPWFQWKG